MSENQELYHLDKLIGFVGDDPAAVKNMVGIFLQTTPELLETINLSFKQRYSEKIAKAAHSLKPTLDVFGIDSLHTTIRSVERKARDGELDNELLELIDSVNTVLEDVFNSLRINYL
ncbi:MAG: Hpt domain-containing protein [Bacteroidales bacterium]|nr:Hpt domain-containing protein [Bacteroidales bacterium]